MLLTIDSSVYLAALIPAERTHGVSQQFLYMVERDRHDVVLPALVPLEVVNTLRRQGLRGARARDLLVKFYETTGTRIVAIDQECSVQLLRQRRRWALKTSDWIIAGLSWQVRAQLISWDQQLVRHTKAALQAQTPEAWLRNHA